MAGFTELFSGFHMIDVGSGSYNLLIIQPMLDVTLFILVFVTLFVSYQIYSSTRRFKSAKCAPCIEGIKFLCFSWVIGTFLFMAALIAGVYARIVYNYVFPIGVSIVMLTAGVIAVFFMLKAMVAFSPQTDHIKTSR